MTLYAYCTVEAKAGLTKDLRSAVQQIIEETGGFVLEQRRNSFRMDVLASDEAKKRIKALQGITSVEDYKAENKPVRKNNGPKFG